jgi:hypothetical protein
MIELQVGATWEFGFNTHVPSTGAEADAAATPTYRVYLKGSDTVVDSGNCSKRDDANTLGFYIATGSINTVYGVGSDYVVRVRAGVAESTSTTIYGDSVVGYFRVVPADVVRDDVWTDAKAAFLTGAVALEATLTALKGAGWTTETLKAIKDAQALEATLTAIKGATWSTQTLEVIVAYVDELETRLTAARAGYMDKIQYLPAAAAGGASGLALFGDKMDLVDAPNATALAAAATAVTEKDLAGYEALAKSGTKLGNMLALLRGRDAGKLVMTATTSTATLVVYEADNVTVMATYDIPLDYNDQGAPS